MDLLSKSLEKIEQVEDKDDADLSKDTMDKLLEHSGRGNPAAQFTLAQYYLKNNDTAKALSLFEQSSSSNCAQAKYQLAVLYYDGVGVDIDAEKGFKLMLQVAESKGREEQHLVPAAEFNIGRAFHQGYGIKQSDQEAVKWWTQCANGIGASHGNTSSVRSMNTLALFYSRPENIDKQKAFYWHERAASFEHPDSLAALGLMHSKGDGCQKSKEMALQLLKKSVDKGSVFGIGMLTHCYYSYKLFSKAIEVAQRLCNLEESIDDFVCKAGSNSFLIRFGQGIIKNDSEAASWYEKAKVADQNVVFELHKLMMQGRL